MTDVHDRSLVTRAREGDEVAFKALCDRCERRMQARIRRRLSGALRRKISPADVLQEAYIVAARRLVEFEDRGGDAFECWMARIVELKTREAVRRFVGTAKRGGKGEISRGRRDDTVQIADGGPSPSQVAMAEELRQAAAQAISELPPHYREVLQLLQQEHLTLQETADRMGRTRESVKAIHARALARLAKRLGFDEAAREH